MYVAHAAGAAWQQRRIAFAMPTHIAVMPSVADGRMVAAGVMFSAADLPAMWGAS